MKHSIMTSRGNGIFLFVYMDRGAGGTQFYSMHKQSAIHAFYFLQSTTNFTNTQS